MNFGEFIKKRRLDLGYTLREFCRTKGQESAYISRLENTICLPPKKEEKLKSLAKAYEIKEGTVLWVDFFDQAAASLKTLPKDLNNENITRFLPAFCRTIRKENITGKDIEKLVKLIKGEDLDGKSDKG